MAAKVQFSSLGGLFLCCNTLAFFSFVLFIALCAAPCWLHSHRARIFRIFRIAAHRSHLRPLASVNLRSLLHVFTHRMRLNHPWYRRIRITLRYSRTRRTGGNSRRVSDFPSWAYRRGIITWGRSHQAFIFRDFATVVNSKSPSTNPQKLFFLQDVHKHN